MALTSLSSSTVVETKGMSSNEFKIGSGSDDIGSTRC